MEKFIVSARKYRPQSFDTVVGQEHITTTLKNAIKNEQLAHAFLFCGPRGVGKTTCARILAKTINCQNITVDGEACNACSSCVSFNEGSSMNIFELDAASNNSVEDIRALVDQVRFAPQGGKYKVYIIDEVHMLSSSAFNAFLKTLEEPPPYAIFILATTEKHKILPTILSRCQIFDFKRITLQDTVNHLKGIAKKENISAEDAALQLIAQKSEGCMRDSLSILDKIVSFTNAHVTYDNTIEHLNILDAEYYFKLMDCMLNQDLAAAMLLFDDIDKKGFEGDMVLNGFAEFIRNLLICKDERVISLLEVVDSFKQKYFETSQKTDPAFLISALNIINEAEINFKAARNKRLHVELTLIKLCYLNQAIEITGNGSGIDKKKLTESAKPLAFKTIQPVFVQNKNNQTAKPEPTATSSAKLIIETAQEEKPAAAQIQEENEIYKPVQNSGSKNKLRSLESLRQQISKNNSQQAAVDNPLTQTALEQSWKNFCQHLKQNKNAALQGFASAKLSVIDSNTFEVEVNSKINQKFIESEKRDACEFLKSELSNKKIQFSISLVQTEEVEDETDKPLSAKEQYQKLVEEFPLVKELKDRLKLDLDY